MEGIPSLNLVIKPRLVSGNGLPQDVKVAEIVFMVRMRRDVEIVPSHDVFLVLLLLLIAHKFDGILGVQFLSGKSLMEDL